MKPSIRNITLIAICSVSRTNGFTLVKDDRRQTLLPVGISNIRNNASPILHASLPRLDLPETVATKLEEFDLKNPNAMNEAEYRSCAGAAIAGTLLFFTVPGALLTGLYNNLGPVAIATIFDFVLSVVTGGVFLIYLSLRTDSIGEKVREYGLKLMTALKDTTGIGTLRFELPVQITDIMTGQLDLLNPNSMNEKDYDGYSGAAVAGTLGFFLLPGALITNAGDVLGGFAGSIIADFLFSAIIGGGLVIYLSLRNDEISDAVNQAGSKLLDAVDGVVRGDSKLLNSKRD